VAESQDESLGYCLDREDIKGAGPGADQTGILRGSTGCLNGLIEMVDRGRIRLNRISTSYGTQPMNRSVSYCNALNIAFSNICRPTQMAKSASSPHSPARQKHTKEIR